MKILKLYNNINEYYDIEMRLNKPKWTQYLTRFVNFIMRHKVKDISHNFSDVCAIDTHIHTAYSHCCFDPIETSLLRASQIGLSGICIMDHHTTEGYKKALELKDYFVGMGKMREDFIIIPGIEYSTKEGHIGGMFCTEDIYFKKYTAAECVDMIHNQGGLAVCVHPYRKKTGIKDLSLTLPFDAVEERAGSIFKKDLADKNYNITKNFNMAKFGSSDAHFWTFIGSCYTVFPKECKSPEDIRNAIINRQTSSAETENIHIIRKLLGR